MRERKKESTGKREKIFVSVCVCFLELPSLCVVILTPYSLIGMRMGKTFTISWVHPGR